MAEYVHRKRPPATHPYWARLHDRTHPPSSRTPTIGLGIMCTMMGIESGRKVAITLADAIWTTANYSFLPCAFFCFIGVIAGLGERDRSRPLMSVGMCLFSAFFTGTVGYLLGLVLFGSYYTAIRWPTGGMGMLYGGLIGAVIGVTVAQIIAWLMRRTWWQRQENWPKWEEMARGHRRREAILHPPEPIPENEALPTGTA